MPAFCEMQKPINGFKVGDLLRGIQSSGLSSKCVLSHCLASSTVAIVHVAVSPFGQVLLPPWLSHHPSLHSRRVLDPQTGHLSISSQDLAALQVCPPIHEITMHLRSSKCRWPHHRLRPFRSIFSPLCLLFLIIVAFTVGRGRKFKNSPATPQARGSEEF